MPKRDYLQITDIARAVGTCYAEASGKWGVLSHKTFFGWHLSGPFLIQIVLLYQCRANTLEILFLY